MRSAAQADAIQPPPPEPPKPLRFVITAPGPGRELQRRQGGVVASAGVRPGSGADPEFGAKRG